MLTSSQKHKKVKDVSLYIFDLLFFGTTPTKTNNAQDKIYEKKKMFLFDTIPIL